MIKALIFDMDGTVVDSTDLDYQAFRKAFSDYGVDFTYEEYIRRVGAKGEEIVASKWDLPPQDIRQLLTRKSENFRDLVEQRGIAPVAGVEAVLDKARSLALPIVLATGSRLEKVKFIFDRLMLSQYFDLILTAEDVHAGKPDPKIYLTAAEKIGVRSEECLVFEDSLLGVQAAKNAGMPVVSLLSSSPEEWLDKADLIVDNFNDVDLEALTRRFSGLYQG